MLEIDNIPVDKDYEYFIKEFETLTTIKLNLYKEKQMHRRINTLIERKGFSGFESYIKELKKNKKELDYFVDYITINVTEFFRTKDQWKVFEDTVIKTLVENRKPFTIWSCASSTGEEPYSLAMSVLLQDEHADFNVIASDIDEKVLRIAEKGIYSDLVMEEVPLEVKNRFFIYEKEQWKIKDVVKKHLEFKKLDLFNNIYPSNVDVIVCRNVLIYFTEEGKEIIYHNFYDSLKKGGHLFTGNTEQIIYYKDYNFKKETNYIYRKDD